ncbi:MAG TPA: DUF1800 domain-containing protein [Gemmatimonadaceae bacterium]|nr:DUF1800 domain-containing protein [Gemmatimonadaceae bacterium]
MIFCAPAFALQAQGPVKAAPSQSRLDHRELAADQQVIHVLNRLTFGAKPGDVRRVRAIGVDAWIDQQLRPEKIDDSSLERFLANYDVLRQDQSELLRQYAVAQRERRMVRREAGDTMGQGVGQRMSRDDSMAMREVALRRNQVAAQIQSSRVARAVAGNRQLEEVMTDFWLNHFNVFIRKGPPQAYYIVEYERDVIRPNSLGKFRDLLGGVAKSPAMLFYLDNARSMADSTRPRLTPAMRRRPNQLQRGGLNENYGRELLELHTVGVDGGYTQQDVIDVARALTGWTIRQPTTGGGFVFRPEMHDAGEKVVLGRKLAAGRGIQDGEDVLDILARHPSTARYIATKLARRFVSDNPPKPLIDHAAAVFTRTDGDIREVVRAIVTSNEFFSRQAFRSKVKSPFEVVVSALRALDAKPDASPRTAQAVAYLGQPIYGHQAPNGYPETGESWMNTGAILNRINFGLAVAANRIPGARIETVPMLDSLRSLDRAKQVEGVIALLLNGSASPDTRATLLSGMNPLVAAAGKGDRPAATASDADTGAEMMMETKAGQTRDGRPRAARRANPIGGGAALPPLTGIAQVVGLALGSPEFQRR